MCLRLRNGIRSGLVMIAPIQRIPASMFQFFLPICEHFLQIGQLKRFYIPMLLARLFDQAPYAENEKSYSVHAHRFPCRPALLQASLIRPRRPTSRYIWKIPLSSFLLSNHVSVPRLAEKASDRPGGRCNLHMAANILFFDRRWSWSIRNPSTPLSSQNLIISYTDCRTSGFSQFRSACLTAFICR